MKTVFRFTFMLAGLAFGMASAAAQSSTAQPADAPSKSAGKKPAAKSEPTKKQEAASKGGGKATNEKEPDIAGLQATPYDCDLGDKLTIYKNMDDNERIALQWKNRRHDMQRIPTSTGADRFEDKSSGWVWIGIPAKGMLLDSKQGRQLANECRSDEQKKDLVKK